VVDRWQDYVDHLGGVTGHFTNDHQIYFSGGFNSPISSLTINQNRAQVGLPPIPNGGRLPEGQGYKEKWSFSVNRLTGKAEFKDTKGTQASYQCARRKAIL
jgi:hypothetical protein